MSENKINRIKEYWKENIKENKKDKLQFVVCFKYSNLRRNSLWKENLIKEILFNILREKK